MENIESKLSEMEIGQEQRIEGKIWYRVNETTFEARRYSTDPQCETYVLDYGVLWLSISL